MERIVSWKAALFFPVMKNYVRIQISAPQDIYIKYIQCRICI